jgi:hypothetical protein
VLKQVTGFLRWQIGDNKPTSTMLGQTGAKGFVAHLEDVVVVAHHQDLEIEAGRRSLHEGKILLARDPGFQGALIGVEKNRAISDRLAEWHLEFDEIGIGTLHCLQHSHVGIEAGISHYGMCHQQ